MSEAVQPIPNRFWWLKRLGLGVIFILLLLVGLRLWWGHRTNARLDALIAEIEARGEPIHFNDMIRDPIPDDQNKAFYLRQALAQWPTVPGLGVVITETDWFSDPENHPDPITDNPAYLAQLEPLMALIEQANAVPDCDWGVRLQSPAINILLPHLAEQRKLARLIRDAAQRASESGDVGSALHMIRLLGAPGEALDAQPSTFITHLVGLSIHSLVSKTTEELLPGMDISSDPTHRSRAEADALLSKLQDETAIHDSYTQGSIGERWMVYDFAMAVLDGRITYGTFTSGGNAGPSLVNNILMWSIRPLLLRDTELLVLTYTEYVSASKVATTPGEHAELVSQAMQNQLGVDTQELLDKHYLLYRLSGWLTIPSGSGTVAYYRLLAQRRLAAAALAIKLYESDHGRRPDTLSQLVPDYLTTIPVDPFAEDGSPIRYRPGGAILIAVDNASGDVTTLAATGPAIVYSVDVGGIDHNGTVCVNYNGKVDQVPRYNEEHNNDVWFMLDEPEEVYPLDPAETTETTETIDDE